MQGYKAAATRGAPLCPDAQAHEALVQYSGSVQSREQLAGFFEALKVRGTRGGRAGRCGQESWGRRGGWPKRATLRRARRPALCTLG